MMSAFFDILIRAVDALARGASALARATLKGLRRAEGDPVARAGIVARASIVAHASAVALACTAAISLALAAAFELACPRFSVPYSFTLYDSRGGLLGASVAEDGQWRLPPRAVPDKVARCLVAFEDKRFYLHPGVDPFALARAASQNARSGTVVSGGSTLTMQTARLALGNRPRTLPNKAKEAIGALLLEFAHTKAGILSLYAAHAPFGGNVVGLEAASWRYYNRSPDHLTWAEAATLAVLPNQPALVHPGANRDALRSKRDRLLLSLARGGDIDGRTLELSLAEALPDRPYPLPRLSPHFLERSKRSGTRETAIERDLQIAVTSVLERWSAQLSASGIRNAAALVVDTESGETLAYVGNTGANRAGQKNADVDLVIARRSSGSVLKPFLYAGMLDAGLLLPDQLVVDIPTRIGSYKPENNVPVYRGVVPADEALSRSLNVPAIRMLRAYGIRPFLSLLSKAGFSTFDRSVDEYGLPLILGGGEVTLEETVHAYRGLMLAASRSERAGSVVRESRAETFSPGAAWLTLRALVDGTRPADEALWRSFASAQKIAWKTGTSYGNRDAWAIGVTSSYAVGVWAGNATGEGRPELKSATTAAPMLFDIFSLLSRSPWPATPQESLENVAVCERSGFPAGPHCQSTRAALKPAGAHLSEPCPYCRTVSLTPDGAMQATAEDLVGTWSGHLPRLERRFVLPPAIERWYVRHDLSYRRLPPFVPWHRGDASTSSLSVVFPEDGARVYIPTELDGEAGSMVAVAAHGESGITLHWDMDGEYLGSTNGRHEIAVSPGPGRHTLTVTDARGNRATRRFVNVRD